MQIPVELKRKYGETLSDCALEPQQATAVISFPECEPFQTQITVCVGPDANTWLWFELANAAPNVIRLVLQQQVIDVSITGTLAGGGSFSIQRCKVSHVHSNSGPCFAVFRGQNMQITAPELPSVAVILLGLSPLVVQHSNPTAKGCLTVRYTLVNALFTGEVDSVEIDGSTRKSRRDKVIFRSPKYEWTLVWRPQFNEEKRSCLLSGLFSFVPTATLETKVNSLGDPKDSDEEAEAICRLLSLASGVATTWVARRICEEETIVQDWFERKCPSTTAEAKSRFEIISNLDASASLRSFLESTIADYRRNESKWRLNEAIDYLEQARHQKVVEIQLAVLVLGLELLSHQWCLMDGLTSQQIEKMNIQTKLARMRKSTFRFIERRFIEDALRANLRNPLLHSGAIPTMKFRELHAWANALYDLSVRILLSILGYRGKYRNVSRLHALEEFPPA